MKRPAFRVLAGGIDQVLSSVSNALVVFAVARSSGVADFGHATLVFSILAAAIGMSRGAIGTPLLLLGGSDPEVIRRESRGAVAGAAVFGIGIGLIVALVSFAVHEGALGIAFGVVVPFALAQDALRFAAVTLGVPQHALCSDALWTAGSVVLLAITWFDPAKPTATAMVWGWGVAAGGALLLLCVSLRLLPDWRGLAAWWRPDRQLRLRFGLDSGIEQLTVIVVVSLSTALIGPVAAAALRGAVTILGPFAILLNALTLVAIPEASRGNYSTGLLWRKLRALTLPASLAALAVGCGSAFLPARLGELVLGDTWRHASAVLPLLGVEYAALCWVGAAYSLFRYRRDTRLVLAIRISQSLFTIALCACIGEVFPTPTGIAAALAVTACLTATVVVLTARDHAAARVVLVNTRLRSVPQRTTSS